MRLESVCEMRLTYRDTELEDWTGKLAMIRPYGGEEGSAYGEGDGFVTGEKLNGRARWVNHPHRRSDGVMLPDVHGIIRTDDGAMVHFGLQGRTVPGPRERGAQLLTVIFESEDERYRWLNNSLCVLEGVIDPGGMKANVWACINDLV
jgi:hypothetical protein